MSAPVVVAIPTIAERAHARDQVAKAWQQHTCQPVDVIFSDVPGGWGAGLNDIWERIRRDPPDILVCGSDDMLPEDDNWLPPLLDLMERGVYPAPCVIDPRFTNYGGHLTAVPDGTPADMSSFPVLHRQWLGSVFPLPAGLSYYLDNLIAVLLARAGIPCVACPSSRIRHLHAAEGRGFGHGSEEQAMIAHSRRYTAALAELGIDRKDLPPGQRGALL